MFAQKSRIKASLFEMYLTKVLGIKNTVIEIFEMRTAENLFLKTIIKFTF